MTLTVNTAADIVNPGDSFLSLREAVTLANSTPAADTIVFAPAVEGQTLTLTGGELTLGQDTTIDGDQNNDGVMVTLSGGNANRIFSISGFFDTDISISDMVLRDGLADGGAHGGAIAAGGNNLTISGATFINNNTYNRASNAGNGGAIFSYGGTINISDSSFIDNYGEGGGAIANSYRDTLNLTVRRC